MVSAAAVVACECCFRHLLHLDTEAHREVRVGETRVECVVPGWSEGRGGEGVVSVGCGVAVAAAVLLLCCAGVRGGGGGTQLRGGLLRGGLRLWWLCLCGGRGLRSWRFGRFRLCRRGLALIPISFGSAWNRKG